MASVLLNSSNCPRKMERGQPLTVTMETYLTDQYFFGPCRRNDSDILTRRLTAQVWLVPYYCNKISLLFTI